MEEVIDWLVVYPFYALCVVAVLFLIIGVPMLIRMTKKHHKATGRKGWWDV